MATDPWRQLSETADSIGGLASSARALVGVAADAFERSGESFAVEQIRVEAAREFALTAADLRRAADALDVLAAGGMRSTKAYRDDAERSPQSWIARHTGVSRHTATTTLGMATTLERYPEIAAAFWAGDITAGHVQLIGGIIPARFCGDDLEWAIGHLRAQQSTILAAAAACETVEEFRDWCKHATERVDTDGPRPNDGDPKPRAASQPSVLDLREMPNGRWRLNGDFNPDDGAGIATMLGDQIVKKRNQRIDQGDDRADGRPYNARLAEALHDLLLTGAGADRPGRVGIFVHINIDDYIADATNAQPDLADLFQRGRAHTEAGLDITDETLWAWLAGDHDITPIFHSGGTPVSYGRTRRTAPEKLRRAIAHRDRTCGFANCDSPFGRNHVHHIDEWDNGGTTDPDNVVGACPINHLQDTHQHGWQIRRNEAGDLETLRPDGTIFDPTPRWRQTRERRRHEGDAELKDDDAA